MIISATEIANAASAYKTWQRNLISFPSGSGRILGRHMISWARAAYETLPPQRDALVLDLRRRIVAGRYFVPAPLIVENLLRDCVSTDRQLEGCGLGEATNW